jgi:hypothetical protein
MSPLSGGEADIWRTGRDRRFCPESDFRFERKLDRTSTSVELSVEALRDAFRDHGFCRGEVNCADLIGENDSEAREPGTVRPMRWLPNSRADQGFSAVKEDFQRRYLSLMPSGQ